MSNTIPGLSIATVTFDDIHSPMCASDGHDSVDKIGRFNEDPQIQEKIEE